MSAFGHIGRGWEDLVVSPTEGDAVNALSYENYRDTDFKMKFFNYTQDDVLYFSYQMSHGWDFNTEITPHMHLVPMANGAGDVVLSGEYYWVRRGYEIPAVSGWTSYKTVTPIVAADQYKEKIVELARITPPDNVLVSSILLIRVERPGVSDADDTYTTNKDHGTPQANLGILSSDVHYRGIKVGSVTEYGTY